MKDFIKVEERRIFSNKCFIVLIGVVFVYSITMGFTYLKQYDIYDANGNKVISAIDNITESKKHKHILNEQNILDVISRKDTSLYLYNTNLTKLIAINYNKKIIDLNNDDINRFYNQRALNVISNMRGSAMQSDIDYIYDKANSINPIEVGYAEGFKNLNNELTDFITVIIFIVPFILLPIFSENSKYGISFICSSTKYGKSNLIKWKIILAFLIGSKIYFISVIIFSFVTLLILGGDGWDLSINSTILYSFSPYNITFLEQYIINILIGFTALCIMISVSIFISIIVKELISSIAILSSTLFLMTIAPNYNYKFMQYFGNFMPYIMTNFNNYYNAPYIYNIFNVVIPTYILVVSVGVLISLVLLLCSYKIAISNLKVRIEN